MLKEKIKGLIRESINKWEDQDIYALSLYVENMEDDPLQPTVMFGFNTEKQFQKSLMRTREAEARWNFAFWLQNSEFLFGQGETAIDVTQWMEKHGFLELPEDEVDEEITRVFVDEIVELVQELHEEKVLSQKFGCELPIIIHELEYYDEIAERNRKANGKYLPNEFVEFCIG